MDRDTNKTALLTGLGLCGMWVGGAAIISGGLEALVPIGAIIVVAYLAFLAFQRPPEHQPVGDLGATLRQVKARDEQQPQPALATVDAPATLAEALGSPLADDELDELLAEHI